MKYINKLLELGIGDWGFGGWGGVPETP